MIFYQRHQNSSEITADFTGLAIDSSNSVGGVSTLIWNLPSKSKLLSISLRGLNATQAKPISVVAALPLPSYCDETISYISFSHHHLIISRLKLCCRINLLGFKVHDVLFEFVNLIL
jgi:hypothetical protein